MKTALLGGTFDPIHYGHLYIAREASRILSLDQVRFLVSGIPPQREGRPMGMNETQAATMVLAPTTTSRAVGNGSDDGATTVPTTPTTTSRPKPAAPGS